MGIVVVVIAVLLFGLTKTSNGETAVDWVSVMTAVGASCSSDRACMR